MTVARDLLAWSARDLATIESLVRPQWAAWLADWDLGPSSSTASCTCRHACEGSGSQLSWTSSRSDGGLWLNHHHNFAIAVAEQMFGTAPDSSSQAAIRIAETACVDLESRLALVLGPAEARTEPLEPEQEVAEWSGGVGVELGYASLRLHVLVSGVWIGERLCLIDSNDEQATDRADLTNELLEVPARAEVSLPPAALSMGALLALEVGDVLHLGHPLTEPLRMTVDGALVCRAHLGRRGITKAVALTHCH